ncbi:Aldo/keto reductase [Wolfiporia cocos MD-104 SS10]|uniref:Aldo/keto reductase n=1 Tax=Wolfiporia cocos (strain MD-104) TaxID=742152 RepID=A0A2H3J6A0_WOLCO|nr:Aldo/keto reductase [Wolfiporia cocos MD-104 SS10]
MAPLTIPLNDGTSIPWLGFGSGTAHYQKDASGTLTTALAHGIHHLDTAQLYGNEDSLAAAIAASGVPRESLYITTKLWALPTGKSVRDTLTVSLAKIGVSYVDLFLVHSPYLYGGADRLREVWREVEDLRAAGLARSIGVSNFDVQNFEEIIPTARIVPAVNQIEYHPYVFKVNIANLEYMRAHNIVPASYGCFAPLTHAKDGPVDPVLAAAATRLGKDTGKQVSLGQVLHLWLRARGIVAITTSTKETRIKEYVATAELPDLTEDELKAIDEAGSQMHHQVFAEFLNPEGVRKLLALQSLPPPPQ